MKVLIGLVATWFASSGLSVNAEAFRGAYPSANRQLHPEFVAPKQGFYKSEDLDAELSTLRNTVTAAQALPIDPSSIYFSR
jgi:hypothetical protein